jgi:hypothetical protein
MSHNKLQVWLFEVLSVYGDNMKTRGGDGGVWEPRYYVTHKMAYVEPEFNMT